MSFDITPEFLKELEAIDYPLPPDNVKILVDKIRSLEAEANWLADRCEQLATILHYEDIESRAGEQSARYWREAARKAITK